MKRGLLVAGITAVVLAVLSVAALLTSGNAVDQGSPAAAAGVQRVIYMSAVEYKGGTNSEPFPSATPPPGGGYIIKPPDATTGRWETSTYRWEPGSIVVDQGDDVELWIWGVNGSQHPSTIEGYVPDFNVTRGNLTVLKFTADTEGIFRITCHAHPPSMEAQLVVLGAETEAQTTPTVTPTVIPTQAPAQLPATGGEPGDALGLNAVSALAVAALLATGLLSLLTLKLFRR